MEFFTGVPEQEAWNQCTVFTLTVTVLTHVLFTDVCRKISKIQEWLFWNLEVGMQNMTHMETKRAKGKCTANALVCQLCWFFLWISRVVPEIFAIKVESCQKSRWILDVFLALPNFSGPAFQKLYTCYNTLWPLSSGTSYGKCFVGILPLAPKL